MITLGIEFTIEQWQEIYYAVQGKLASSTVEGQDKVAREWRSDLTAILERLERSGITL